MFLEAALRHFGYLTDELGFRVTRDVDHLPGMGHETTFESNRCRVRIGHDRGEVYVLLGPNEKQGPRRIWFDLLEVIRHVAPHAPLPVLHAPGEFADDLDARLDAQLAVFAPLLRRHAVRMLAGDFAEIQRLP